MAVNFNLLELLLKRKIMMLEVTLLLFDVAIGAEAFLNGGDLY